MPVSRPRATSVWPLVVAICCMIPVSGGADDRPSVDDQLRAPFGLQYSIQSGDRLLAPVDRDAPHFFESPSATLQLAAYWEPASDSPGTEWQVPAKAGAANSLDASSHQDANAGSTDLFQSLSPDGTSHWSTSLDSAAEDRVDSAIRSTGFAVLLLGIALVGFLGWLRVRGSKLSAPTETTDLLERGRLPISQTCRLHLVRAGTCDVLVAVDRGSVRAMTPLPGDFSQLTTMPFDAPTDADVFASR